MSKSGKRLIAAAKEAVAIARGKRKPASIKQHRCASPPRKAKAGTALKIR
jgi:hypothetical protein